MSKASELANLIGNINAGGGGVNRNLVINGAMNVAQRATSSTGIGASSGYFTCDRWLFGREAGTEQARFTMTQDTASVGIDSLPFQEAGIRTALKMDVTTAESAVASGESSLIMQRIEGFNCSNLDIKNKPITLSFYAKSDAKTGTMCASLYAGSGGRHHVKEYSITTDWQRFSLTFPADSGATALANDNTNELQVNFVLTAGSNFQVTADQWASGFDTATSNQINFADSTDNNWYLTGVQLEIGQNPTEFERESFAVTEAKAQRYCQFNTAEFADAYNSTTGSRQVVLRTPMRATPTASIPSGGTNKILDIGTAYRNLDSLGGFELSNSYGGTQVTNISSTSGGNGDGDAYCHIITGGCILYDAEL
jgi:hypothetical protein